MSTKTIPLLDFKKLIFNNSKVNIIIDKKGNRWFKGKDIATILGYGNTKQSIITNVNKEDKNRLGNINAIFESPLSYNERNTIYINETGLYSLILSSKKHRMSNFKRWITSEVMPTIIKFNEYRFDYELDLSNKNTSYNI